MPTGGAVGLKGVLSLSVLWPFERWLLRRQQRLNLTAHLSLSADISLAREALA